MRHKGSRRVEGVEEEDDFDDLEYKFNYSQKNGGCATNYGFQKPIQIFLNNCKRAETIN